MESFRDALAIDALRQQKEQELKQLSDYKVTMLQKEIEQKQAQLETTQTQLQALKNDFMYNLKLLEDRDAELQRYDSGFTKYVQLLQDRDQELGQLKVTIADVRSQLKQEQARSSELEVQLQSRVGALQEKLREASREQTEALRMQREETSAEMLELKAELRTRKQMLASERVQLLSNFEKQMHIQRQDWNATESELREEIAMHQGRAQSATEELAQARSESKEQAALIEELRRSHNALEEEVRSTEWRTKAADQDRAAVVQRCDLQLADQKRKHLIAEATLAAQVEAARKRVKELEERLKGQHASHLHVQRQEQKEKDALVKRLEQAFDERAETYQSTISALQHDLEKERTECRRAQGLLKSQQRQIEELRATGQRDAEVARLKADVQRAQLEGSEARREVVSLQGIVKTLQDAAAARAEALAQCRSDLDHAQAALEEERRDAADQKFEAEHRLAQLQEEFLDAQNAVALAEAQRDRAVNSLSRSQEQGTAFQRQVDKLREQLRVVTGERDVARRAVLSTVRQSDEWDMGPASPLGSLPSSPSHAAHPIPAGTALDADAGAPPRAFDFQGTAVNRSSPDTRTSRHGTSRGSGFSSQDVQRERDVLREENARLTSTVAQMKREMEALAESLATAQSPPPAVDEAPDAAEPPPGSDKVGGTGTYEDSSTRLQIHRLQQHIQLLVKRVEAVPGSEQNELVFLRRYVNELHGVVEVLRVEVSRARISPMDPSADRTRRQLMSQNAVLRSQLSEAHQHLDRMITERERLLEISNLLRADLSKASLQLPPPTLPVPSRHQTLFTIPERRQHSNPVANRTTELRTDPRRPLPGALAHVSVGVGGKNPAAPLRVAPTAPSSVSSEVTMGTTVGAALPAEARAGGSLESHTEDMSERVPRRVARARERENPWKDKASSRKGKKRAGSQRKTPGAVRRDKRSSAKTVKVRNYAQPHAKPVTLELPKR